MTDTPLDRIAAACRDLFAAIPHRRVRIAGDLRTIELAESRRDGWSPVKVKVRFAGDGAFDVILTRWGRSTFHTWHAENLSRDALHALHILHEWHKETSS